MKIYRRPRTWLMVGFLILALGLMSGLMKWDESRSDPANWQQSLTQQNAHYQKQLADNKDLDSDYKEYMTNEIKINEYYLANDMNPYALSLWDYVNNSAALVMLITILTVIVAADMIAAEFT